MKDINSYREGRTDEKKDIIKIVEKLKYCERGYPHKCEKHPEDCDFCIEYEELIKEINNPKNKSDWVEK